MQSTASKHSIKHKALLPLYWFPNASIEQIITKGQHTDQKEIMQGTMPGARRQERP